MSALPFAQSPAAWKDPSPHRAQFVTVDTGVRLEVLDWGGSGRPLVLLAGGGNTAHVFNDFAPKLTGVCHVYGITRRGFGASGFSPDGFGADRLGDDVIAVLDALKLDTPVLAGHSIAGEELSSVGTRRPDRVAGLIYLDAAYPYAFDNGTGPSVDNFQKLQAPQPPESGESDLASFSALARRQQKTDGFAFPEAELRQQRDATTDGRVGRWRDSPASPLLLTGMKKYASLRVPALIIFADPHGQGSWVDNSADPAVHAAARAYTAALSALVEKQIRVVRSCAPAAHVVTIAGAHHYVYLSNESEVLREMRAFLANLPTSAQTPAR